jgi:hypothetical protein
MKAGWHERFYESARICWLQSDKFVVEMTLIISASESTSGTDTTMLTPRKLRNGC